MYSGLAKSVVNPKSAAVRLVKRKGGAGELLLMLVLGKELVQVTSSLVVASLALPAASIQAMEWV